MRNARFMLLVLLSSLLVLNGCSRRDILDDYPVGKGPIGHLPLVWGIHCGGKKYNFCIFRILSLLIASVP